MSLDLDLTAINDRFLDVWNTDAIATTFANAEAIDPDEAKPFVRFSIVPGARQRTTIGGGPIHIHQLGRVWLQILIPKGDGDADAYRLADTFNAIFLDWKSADGCVRTYESDIQAFPRGENGMFQVNVSIPWESQRYL